MANGLWHRNPAARGANGRVRPGHALVKGKAVPVADGVYEIRFYEDRRSSTVRREERGGRGCTARPPGADRLCNGSRRRRRASDRSHRDRKTLRGSAAAYISDAEGRGAMAAARMARSATKEFLGLVKRRSSTRFGRRTSTSSTLRSESGSAATGRGRINMRE